jgi:ATP-dependent Clp protease ATP-binding subunit ClpC
MPDDNSYEVIKVFIKEADFNVLILRIPEDEIEDKMAYLAREKGQITRSLFEDFVIASTVANINQFIFHLNQQSNVPPNLMEVREELMKAILKINPLLDPNNLIINKNHVIKIKKRKKLNEDEKLLTENKNWELSYYDEIANIYRVSPEEVGDDNKKKGKKSDKKGKKQKKEPEEAKEIDSLDFKVIEKWWKRIGQYVKIRKYSPDDVVHILKHRFFHNRTSFETFIVSVCIVDFEELFSLLDNLGIPQRVAPPILMHELYELCRAVNDFLTFENAQEMAEEFENNDFDRMAPPGMHPGRVVTPGQGMSQYTGKKKKKKLFKDVPKEDLLKIGDSMKVFLIGQDEAVNKLTDAIQRASVGLKDPNKPIGSFLFAGRTGVGKTLATKVLADELIRGRDNMVTIDCSEYTADHEYSKLIGAPSGYVGHEQGGFLTNAVAKNPFTVVVFDEVEKASYKVHQLLLQILEEGRLTDGRGQTVSFKNAVLVMTSNVGVKEIEEIKKTIGFGNAGILTEDKKNTALNEALKRKFKPEFLNRIDSIINFRALDKKDYLRIIDLELYKLNDNLRSNDTEYKNIELKFDNKIRNHVYKKGIDEEYGARPLKRCIEKEVSTPLAKRLLEENLTGVDSTILVSASKKEAVFEVEKKVSELPFYISEEYSELMAETVSSD